MELRLLDDRSNLLKTVLSFANGTFHFDDVSLGRFAIEVIDSRFNLATVPLWLREPEETSKEITVKLVANDGSMKPISESPELDKMDFSSLELDGSLPAAALDEYKKGMETVRQRGKDADAHFRKAVERAPSFYEAHYQLGLELARQKRIPEAVSEIERAVRLRPSRSISLSTLGRLYVESGDFPKGVDTLLKVEPIRPFTAEDHYYLAIAYYKLDVTDRSQEHFEAAISLEPNRYPGAYVQLSNALQRNGDPKAALIALESYLRLFPNDPNHKAVEDGAKKLRAVIQKNPD